MTEANLDPYKNKTNNISQAKHSLKSEAYSHSLKSKTKLEATHTARVKNQEFYIQLIR